MNKFTIYNLKFLILLLLLFVSYDVFASTLSVNTDTKEIKTGEIFTATILLNTEGKSVNTIEGDLKYDDEILKAEIINLGSSFISLWIEKPNLKSSELIHFSGITPGGISTTNGEVFSVIFKAKTKGNISLLLDNTHLFLNDGLGTEANIKTKGLSVAVKEAVFGTEDQSAVLNDKYTPEKFNITRTRDPSLFDNKYFIAFDTQDKDSGIDHYRVCELFVCVETESPFLLKNQTPFFYVKVIAYDFNGNFISSSITSPYLLALILLIILVFAYLYRRYLYSYKV